MNQYNFFIKLLIISDKFSKLSLYCIQENNLENVIINIAFAKNLIFVSGVIDS